MEDEKGGEGVEGELSEEVFAEEKTEAGEWWLVGVRFG